MPDDLTPAERGRAWTVVERDYKIRSMEDDDDVAQAFVVHDNDRCLHRELADLEQALARADTAERTVEQLREALRTALAGKPILGVVDHARLTALANDASVEAQGPP